MEMAMYRWSCWIFWVLAALAAAGACGPRALPPQPAAVVFLPGEYLKESYFASDFNPAEAVYFLSAFPVAQASNASAEAFRKIFAEELVRAWQAQGLKIGSGKDACSLSGTIHRLAVRGARLRWLTGRLFASLTISGTITRGTRVLFAFRDQVYLSSPLAPGLAAPREKDLLLARLARETVNHLLNELLLHGSTPKSG
jgi:hypothetical protein